MENLPDISTRGTLASCVKFLAEIYVKFLAQICVKFSAEISFVPSFCQILCMNCVNFFCLEVFCQICAEILRTDRLTNQPTYLLTEIQITS